jgi:hypothetical protein
MSYNSQDPFDAAAWWFMQLCCQDCGTMLEYDLKSRIQTAQTIIGMSMASEPSRAVGILPSSQFRHRSG